jgi:hypothetical protein
LPLTLYFQYDYGADLADEWANRWIPRFGFRQGLAIKQTLIAQPTFRRSRRRFLPPLRPRSFSLPGGLIPPFRHPEKLERSRMEVAQLGREDLDDRAVVTHDVAAEVVEEVE